MRERQQGRAKEGRRVRARAERSAGEGGSWLTEVEGCASHQVRLCGRINPALLDQLAVQVPRRREVPADARRHEAGLALRVRRPRLAASFFDQVCPAACSALKTETNSHTQRAGWEGGGGVLGGSQRATSSRPAAAASQSGVRPCRFGRSTSTRSCSTRWRATARCPVCSGVQQFSNSTSAHLTMARPRAAWKEAGRIQGEESRACTAALENRVAAKRGGRGYLACDGKRGVAD